MPDYQALKHTAYPPLQKPLMVWDGECAFCAYWIAYWQKAAGDCMDFAPYQAVAKNFPDINTRHFMLASRLIEPDGSIHSGPGSAFRSFRYFFKGWSFLDAWYREKLWFRRATNAIYRWVTQHRDRLYKLMPYLFGSDSTQMRPFWLIYLAVFLWILYQIS